MACDCKTPFQDVVTAGVASIIINAILPASTDLFWEVTDKFGNVYLVPFTTDENGMGELDTTALPAGFLNAAIGAFSIRVKTTPAACEYVPMVMAIAYQALEVEVISGNTTKDMIGCTLSQLLAGGEGDNSTPGADGHNGWTPVPAIVSDGFRRVQQVIDWTGGSGTKPATGQYVGASGFTSVLADAEDVRGAVGATGATGATGPQGPSGTGGGSSAWAPLSSPAFTDVPTAPTAALGTNTTQIATMAAIKAAIDALVAGAPGALDTLNEIAAQLANDESAASAIVTTLGNKVDKVSGKGLSTEDYTTTEKNKLATLSPLDVAKLLAFLSDGGNVIATQEGLQIRFDMNWNGVFDNPDSIPDVGGAVLTKQRASSQFVTRAEYDTEIAYLLTQIGGGGGGSAFDPLTNTNLLAFFKKGVGQTVVGGKITAWADQSTNAYSLVGVTGQEPASNTDGGATFTGAQGMYISNFDLSAVQDVTAYMVVVFDTAASIQTLMEFSAVYYVNGGFLAIVGDSGDNIYAASAEVGSANLSLKGFAPVPVGTPVVLRLQWCRSRSTQEAVVWINNVLGSATPYGGANGDSSAPFGIADLNIGDRNHGSGVAPFQGKIQEIIILAHDSGPTEASLNETYLKTSNGIS